MDAENYERWLVGGLKGNSMLREIVSVSAILAILGCSAGMALVLSTGKLKTEQSEQH